MISLGWYTDFVSRPYESLNYFLSFLDLFCNDYLHIFTVLLHKQTNTMLYWIYAEYRMLTILGRPGFEHHTPGFTPQLLCYFTKFISLS